MKKKLKLGKLEITSEEVIERSQLSNVFGGSGGSGGGGYCVLLGSGNSIIDTLNNFDPNLSEHDIRYRVGNMCLNLQPTCKTWQCYL